MNYRQQKQFNIFNFEIKEVGCKRWGCHCPKEDPSNVHDYYKGTSVSAFPQQDISQQKYYLLCKHPIKGQNDVWD